MKKTIELTEDKILEFSQKSYSDTLNIAEELSEDGFNNICERFKNIGQDDKNLLATSYFNKGRKLYLEITVQDTYASGALFAWLFGKSEFDNRQNHFIGCSLSRIHFSMPSGYSDSVKDAIIKLYEDAIGV